MLIRVPSTTDVLLVEVTVYVSIFSQHIISSRDLKGLSFYVLLIIYILLLNYYNIILFTESFAELSIITALGARAYPYYVLY